MVNLMMTLDRTARKLLITIAASMVWTLAIAEECEVRPVEEKADEYAVYDSDGVYKGYVALEADGSWFAWVEGQGARNDTFETREQASDTICNAKD
jgi:hypothetical protein